MMNETLARQALMTVVAQIVEDWTEYPLVIETDNRNAVDQSQQVEPYLKVMIDFLGGHQADMADNPIERHYGQIVLQVVVRCGDGTAEGATLRDFIRPYFSLKNLGGLQLEAAERHKSREILGWEHLPLLATFYFHALSQ